MLLLGLSTGTLTTGWVKWPPLVLATEGLCKDPAVQGGIVLLWHQSTENQTALTKKGKHLSLVSSASVAREEY